MSTKLPQDKNKANKNDPLKLQDKNGKSFDLKADRVDHLFAHTELYLQTTAKQAVPKIAEEETKELAEKLLARFGLKSSQDVITFLKSKAGESTLTKIKQDLINLAAIKDHLAFEQREDQLRQNRVIAFLLLGLLYKKESMAHQAYAYALEAQEKALHHPKVETAVSSPTTRPVDYDALSVLTYSSAADALEKNLQNLLQDAKSLEKDIAMNEKQRLISESRFKTINDVLIENQDFGTNKPLEDLTNPDLIIKIEDKIACLTKEIEEERDKVYHLVDRLDEKAPDYQEQRDKLAPLLEGNFAKGVRISDLEDMVAVLKKQKVLYTANGEKALTFDQADYIFDADQVLVKRNDKLYLIKKGESFDSMSIEDQEKAANNYKAMSKEEIMGVKNLINQYNKQEMKEANEHRSVLSDRSELMQHDILLMANQLSEMQSAASNAELALKKTPTPPTPGSKMTPAPCTSQYYSDSYKHILSLMKTYPTEQSIDRLKYITARVDYSPELKKEINSLKPGIPIPAQIMNRLLAIKDFGTNWLDVRKPDRVTLDTNSPVAPKKEPTPFSMNPFNGG